MKLSEDEAKRFLERLCPLQETEQQLLCPRCGRNELSVSYTHLDVYKRQGIRCRLHNHSIVSLFLTPLSTIFTKFDLLQKNGGFFLFNRQNLKRRATPMYKPHTIEQYKIQQFLDHTFAMEHFLVSPLSLSLIHIQMCIRDRQQQSFGCAGADGAG